MNKGELPKSIDDAEVLSVEELKQGKKLLNNIANDILAFINMDLDEYD